MSHTGAPCQPGRNRVRARIRRHPIVSFFVMAFTLTWAAWTPYVLSESGLGIVHFNFPVIGGNTQLTGALPGGLAGPILSAFLVTAATDGRPGLREWAGRLFRWRVSWRWYAGVLIGVPAALAVTCSALSGGHMHAPAATVLAGYIPVLLLEVVTTGVAEEPGWRDFALPRLQRRYGPLRGTLILGPLWGAWHLPLFLTVWGGWPHVPWTEPAEFVAGGFALSIVMTWIFNGSGESLPIAMIAHASINTFASLALPQMFPSLSSQDVTDASLLVPAAAAAAAALVVLAATRGRLGYCPVPRAQPRSRPPRQAVPD